MQLPIFMSAQVTSQCGLASSVAETALFLPMTLLLIVPSQACTIFWDYYILEHCGPEVKAVHFLWAVAKVGLTLE